MKQLSKERIARMTPESRERYLKRLRKVKRNRRLAVLFAMLVVLAVTAYVLCNTVFFNITSIEVADKSKFYTKNEIEMAAGFDVGSNMFRTDFDKAADRIVKSLPYLRSVQISKNLAGKITIHLTDNSAAMITETAGGYAVTDLDGKVLEISKEPPEGLLLLELKTAGKVTAEVGEQIAFEDSKDGTIYSELTAELKKAGILSKMTEMDLTNHSKLYAVYQNRFRFNIGDASDLENKIKAAAKTIELEDEADPNSIGEINITIPQRVYVSPLESLDEDEKSDKKPSEPDNQAEDVDNTALDENSQQSSDENEQANETYATDDESRPADEGEETQQIEEENPEE